VSLPRSGRGASRSAGRSAPARGGGRVLVQAPQSDVFVALLGVALGAMILGCLLLVLKLNEYGFELKATAVSPAAPTALAEFSQKPFTVHL
jgi:hypothetical protein